MKALLKKMLPRGVREALWNGRSAIHKVVWRFKMVVPVIHRVLLPGSYKRGYRFARDWLVRQPGRNTPTNAPQADETANPLWTYFANHTEGPGIWKWEHYFEIYERHFAKFVGTKVNLLEIGIYSGGSLDMWTSYFGSESHVYGVDIEQACKVYERENVSIFIGDQEDPGFWDDFRRQVPGIDILIDDGGHTPQQQIVTLEKMLPFLAPGGVYLCEDVYGIHHRFAAYTAGLVNKLNEISRFKERPGVQPTPFQSACHSIHFYPYVVVIEKHEEAPARFICPKRGTEWSPFYRQGWGGAMGDPLADEILSELLRRQPDGMTSTEISDHFGRKQTKDRIGEALALLSEHGLARCEYRKTGGRASEIWHVSA